MEPIALLTVELPKQHRAEIAAVIPGTDLTGKMLALQAHFLGTAGIPLASSHKTGRLAKCAITTSLSMAELTSEV